MQDVILTSNFYLPMAFLYIAKFLGTTDDSLTIKIFWKVIDVVTRKVTINSLTQGSCYLNI